MIFVAGGSPKGIYHTRSEATNNPEIPFSGPGLESTGVLRLLRVVGALFAFGACQNSKATEWRHQKMLDFNTHENDWLERDTLVCCPDPEEDLVMRIERVARRTMDSDDLT